MRRSELAFGGRRDADTPRAILRPVSLRQPQPTATQPPAAPPMRRWKHLPPATRRILVVTALSLGLQAHALQVLEASDGVAVEAIVSQKEPTRIRIEGSPITDVFGNIHSSHCGGAPLPAPASPGFDQ